MSVKVVDCFIFYNEFDMLVYRLNVLYDVVDYFVVVESRHTFVGKEKPLFFAQHKAFFEKWKNKIVHVVVDDFPFKHPVNVHQGQQWQNEYFQRNAIARGISALSLDDCDVVIIADVDEIPDPQTLLKIKRGETTVSLNILEMDMYYYNLNTRFKSKWSLCKIIKFGLYKQMKKGCSELRNQHCSPILKGGWHLSYFGDAGFIQNKIKNFSHQEYNQDFYTNVQKIQDRVKNGKDLYDRNIEMESVKLSENAYAPPSAELYLKKYTKY
jgi:beta-1,4-mannosyl-glycoprotein beta-1,4-N-acetylglucosaminyltransferase